MLPVASKVQYPPSGPSGRGQFGNRISEPIEGASFDPLIGRKVRTRWPDDNNFYEAVITNYNPADVCHTFCFLDLESYLVFKAVIIICC